MKWTSRLSCVIAWSILRLIPYRRSFVIGVNLFYTDLPVLPIVKTVINPHKLLLTTRLKTVVKCIFLFFQTISALHFGDFPFTALSFFRTPGKNRGKKSVAMYRNGKDAMYHAADSSANASIGGGGVPARSSYSMLAGSLQGDVKLERLVLTPDLEETLVPHHTMICTSGQESTSPSTTTNPLFDGSGDFYDPEAQDHHLNALQHLETSTTTSDISDPLDAKDDGSSADSTMHTCYLNVYYKIGFTFCFTKILFGR